MKAEEKILRVLKNPEFKVNIDYNQETYIYNLNFIILLYSAIFLHVFILSK